MNYKRLHLITITSLIAISVSVFFLPFFFCFVLFCFLFRSLIRGHYQRVSVTAAIEPQPQ